MTKKTQQESRFIQWVSLPLKWQVFAMIIGLVSVVVVYIYLCDLLSGIWLLTPFVSPFCATRSLTEDRMSSLMTRHFLDSFTELSTSVPRFEKVPLVKDQYTQYSVKRRQLDMIENLATIVPRLDDPDLTEQVLQIKDQILNIHMETASSEDAFKDAVSSIEATTVYLIRQLPPLQDMLVDGQFEGALHQLGTMTTSLATLIKRLEETSQPVAKLRHQITGLATDINILQSQLQYIDHRTTTGLVSHDRHLLTHEKAGWLERWRQQDQMETRNVQYDHLILLHHSIADMKSASDYLDETFEHSELQVQIALNHLRGASRRLSLIYTELSHSSSEITRQNIKGLRFTTEQLATLDHLNRETTDNLRRIRRGNEPILRAIEVHGYGAIGPDETQ